MSAHRVVLVHGYSDRGESFNKWKAELEARGFDVSTIHTCTYRSLTNEVTIKDIAEGFDRALRLEPGLNGDEPFSAIVHSTGMLVVRAWLTTYARRRKRLKRLIALAPATFGSPLAHKGRSFLGAIFKGNKQWGPDFLEAGDRILDGLELGSRFTWDLAHEDLFGDETYYGPDGGTPYVFVFCGNQGYGGLKWFINDPGSDGTVRLAGTPLNCRKILMDLTVDAAREGPAVKLIEPKGIDSPLYLIRGKDHGSIMSNPGKTLVKLVAEALKVSSKEELDRWSAAAHKRTADGHDGVEQWQQFVVRCTDERGDPITDYNLQLMYDAGGWIFGGTKQFDLDVHTYRADPSLRCFHLNLTKLKRLKLKSLKMRVIASSGSELVVYHGHGSDKTDPKLATYNPDGKWDATFDLTKYLKTTDANQNSFTFFYPFTTTLLELRLNREPAPLDLTKKNKVCWFGEPA